MLLGVWGWNIPQGWLPGTARSYSYIPRVRCGVGGSSFFVALRWFSSFFVRSCAPRVGARPEDYAPAHVLVKALPRW